MIHGTALSDAEDVKVVQFLIYQHLEKTDSARAKDILDRWDHFQPLFVKVTPKIEPLRIPDDEPEEAGASVGGVVAVR